MSKAFRFTALLICWAGLICFFAGCSRVHNSTVSKQNSGNPNHSDGGNNDNESPDGGGNNDNESPDGGGNNDNESPDDSGDDDALKTFGVISGIELTADDEQKAEHLRNILQDFKNGGAVTLIFGGNTVAGQSLEEYIILKDIIYGVYGSGFSDILYVMGENERFFKLGFSENRARQEFTDRFGYSCVNYFIAVGGIDFICVSGADITGFIDSDLESAISKRIQGFDTQKPFFAIYGGSREAAFDRLFEHSENAVLITSQKQHYSDQVVSQDNFTLFKSAVTDAAARKCEFDNIFGDKKRYYCDGGFVSGCYGYLFKILPDKLDVTAVTQTGESERYTVPYKKSLYTYTRSYNGKEAAFGGSVKYAFNSQVLIINAQIEHDGAAFALLVCVTSGMDFLEYYAYIPALNAELNLTLHTDKEVSGVKIYALNYYGLKSTSYIYSDRPCGDIPLPGETGESGDLINDFIYSSPDIVKWENIIVANGSQKSLKAETEAAPLAYAHLYFENSDFYNFKGKTLSLSAYFDGGIKSVNLVLYFDDDSSVSALINFSGNDNVWLNAQTDLSILEQITGKDFSKIIRIGLILNFDSNFIGNNGHCTVYLDEFIVL